MSATHAPYAFTEEVAMTVADAPESNNHQNSDCPSFQNSDKSGSKTGMYLRSSCEAETVSCTFKNVEVAVLFKTTLLLTSETNPWENSAASPVEPSPCKPKNHGSCRFGGVVQLDSCWRSPQRNPESSVPAPQPNQPKLRSHKQWRSSLSSSLLLASISPPKFPGWSKTTEHASVSGKWNSGSSKNCAGKISENGGKLSKKCVILDCLCNERSYSLPFCHSLNSQW